MEGCKPEALGSTRAFLEIKALRGNVCIYKRTYIYIYIYMYLCIYVYITLHIYIYIYIYTHLFSHPLG